MFSVLFKRLQNFVNVTALHFNLVHRRFNRENMSLSVNKSALEISALCLISNTVSIILVILNCDSMFLQRTRKIYRGLVQLETDESLDSLE